jgi:hypothetical protein
MKHCPKCHGLMPQEETRCLHCGFESHQQSGISPPALHPQPGGVEPASTPASSPFAQDPSFGRSANIADSSSEPGARPGIAATGQAAKSRSKRQSYLLYLPTAIGIVALCFSVYGFYNSYTLVTTGSHANGTVIVVRDSRMGSGKIGDRDIFYKPVVQYKTSKGESIEFSSAYGSSRPRYSKGMTVEVLYLPGDPDNAEINDFYALWMDQLEKAGAGLIFLSVGWLIAIAPYLYSRRAKHLRKDGVRIETKLHRVEVQKFLGIGQGKNIVYPYRVFTQWQDPQTMELRIFKSERVWSDPSPYIERNRSIDVFLDRNNPKKYCVDLSFLDPAANDEAGRKR